VVTDLFTIWWEKHHDQPVAERELDEEVRGTLDPQGRGRQYRVAQLEKLAGTRMAGFVLTRQAPAGKWGAATYSLKRTNAVAEDGIGHGGHRDHRDHRGSADQDTEPMPPMGPMPDGALGAGGPAGVEIHRDVQPNGSYPAAKQ